MRQDKDGSKVGVVSVPAGTALQSASGHVYVTTEDATVSGADLRRQAWLTLVCAVLVALATGIMGWWYAMTYEATRPTFVLSRVHSDPEVCRQLGGAIDADENGETMCLTPCDVPP